MRWFTCNHHHKISFVFFWNSVEAQMTWHGTKAWVKYAHTTLYLFCFERDRTFRIQTYAMFFMFVISSLENDILTIHVISLSPKLCRIWMYARKDFRRRYPTTYKCTFIQISSHKMAFPQLYIAISMSIQCCLRALKPMIWFVNPLAQFGWRMVVVVVQWGIILVCQF